MSSSTARRYPNEPPVAQVTGDPGVRFAHFEVHSLIGRGGMAEVFRGVDLEGPRRGWPVAIKRLLPEFARDETYVRHFLREAALCQTLSHPHIVTLYESGTWEGVHYIAMELLDGRDLAQVLRRCAERHILLPVDFAVYLTRVLLEALDGAHARGIVHCDVSPSNLFISRTGEIKLGDFGVARTALAGESTALVAGKPYYVSPEALDGRVDLRADLWAASVTLYELLTLEWPFTGASVDEVLKSIVYGRYRAARRVRRDLPRALSKLLDRALSPRPDRRFASARELSEALRAHHDELVGTPLAIAAVVRGLFGLA
ncbi:MAG: serine/threonine-protein kinase [Myxococcales bacterium]